MFIKKSLIFLTGILVSVSGIFTAGPPQAVDQSHEVTVRLVLVDVIAMDNRGKLVTDLTSDELQIFEEGKPVKLNSLDFIDFQRPQPDMPAEMGSKRKKRFFVIFDSINTITRMLNRNKGRLTDNLAELIRAGGEVMILEMQEKGGIKVLQDLTSDLALISEGVKKATGSIWVERAAEDLKAPAILMRREVTDRAVYQAGVGIINTAKDLYEFKTRLRFEKSLSNLLSAMTMIKDYPGRKPVLLVSGGFPILSLEMITSRTGIESNVSHSDISAAKIRDPFKILQKGKTRYGDDIFENLVQFANSHNITFYTLDPDMYIKYLLPDMFDDNFILAANFAEIKQHELHRLKYFADDTGGDALQGANKYKEFSERINQDLFSYYELSYYPSRKDADGEYHKIQVKCTRPGVKISFRKGYFDYDQDQAESLVFASSSSNPQLFKDISFQAKAIPYYARKGKIILWFTVAMPVKGLVLSPDPDKKFKVLKMNFWMDDPQDKHALNATLPIPIALTKDFRERLAAARFYGHNTRSDELNIKADTYKLIFSLYDEESRTVGTSEQMLEIPGLDAGAGPRFLSSVFGRLRPVKEKALSFSISEKDGTLAAGDYLFYPMGANNWVRTQPIGFFCQVLQTENSTDLQAAAFLLQNGREAARIPVEVIKTSRDKKIQVLSTALGLDFKDASRGTYTLRISLTNPGWAEAIEKDYQISLL
jgi:VWFA-related protein